jgi:MFS family permease
MGLATALWIVSGSPFMMENSSPEERNALFSANFGFQTLVGFFGTLVGGVLPTLFAGILMVGAERPAAYASTLALAALLSLASIVPLLWIDEIPPTRRVDLSLLLPWRNISSPRIAIRLIIPNLLISIGAAILIPYMNLFFKESFPITDAGLGVIFAVASVVTGLATLSTPAIADRWGRIRALSITQLVSIPFLLMIGFVPFLWIAALAFWMRGALMNMVHPLFNAFAMEQVPESERATISGLMGMSWMSGWAIGPFISGYLQSEPGIGFKPIFVITCLFYLVAVILLRRFWQRVDDRQCGASATAARPKRFFFSSR